MLERSRRNSKNCPNTNLQGEKPQRNWSPWNHFLRSEETTSTENRTIAKRRGRPCPTPSPHMCALARSRPHRPDADQAPSLQRLLLPQCRCSLGQQVPTRTDSDVCIQPKQLPRRGVGRGIQPHSLPSGGWDGARDNLSRAQRAVPFCSPLTLLPHQNLSGIPPSAQLAQP